MKQKNIIFGVLGSFALATASFYAGRLTDSAHRGYFRVAAVQAPVAQNQEDANGYVNRTQESRATTDATTSVQTVSSYMDTSSSGNPSLQVWVNTRTHVYHLPGSRWYGLTKDGAYMSMQDAIAAGYRPSGRG